MIININLIFNSRVPFVAGWILSYFSYFQTDLAVDQSKAGVSVINLEGLALTYQVFDFSLEGAGTIVFQEDGVTKSVGENELKVTLTRGLTESQTARLIIIGNEVTKISCRVNFGGVIDLLLREYWSVVLAMVVVQMIFISASMIRGKRPSRILWDVLDAIGKFQI